MKFGIHTPLEALTDLNLLHSFLSNRTISMFLLSIEPPFLDKTSEVVFSEEHLAKFEKIAEFLKNLDIEVHLRFSTLRNENLIRTLSSVTLENHLGEKSSTWICPNQPFLTDFFANAFKVLYSRSPCDGFDFADARFPILGVEDKGFGCFCEICQEEALKKRSVENLIDRRQQDLFKEGFDLNETREFLLASDISAKQHSINILNVKELSNWMKFRRNSITRFVGGLLVQARKIHQGLNVGCDAHFLQEPQVVGHQFPYLLSYQDMVYFWFSKDSANWKDNYKTVQKAQKKAEGKISIGIVLPIKAVSKDSILKFLRQIERTPDLTMVLEGFDRETLPKIQEITH